MAHDVFISHATEDGVTAQAVCSLLEQKGIRCWIAPRDIRPGADWPASIVDAIRRSRVMVLVFSRHANESREIPKEVSLAAREGISIITLRIEDVAPAGSLDYNLNNVHWLDALTPPLEEHVDRLFDTLTPLLGRDQRTGAAEAGPSWKRTLVCAMVFAATGAAIAASFWISAGLSGYQWSHAAPFLAATTFGFALASSVLVRRRDVWIVGLASPVLFGGAFWVSLGSSRWWLPVGGALGAAALAALCGLGGRRLLVAVPIAAAAGAGSMIAGFRWRPGVFPFELALWQVLVGSVIVEVARRRMPRSRLHSRTLPALPLALAGIALVFTVTAPLLKGRLEGDGLYPGKSATNPVDGAVYRWIPAGSFRMGCSTADEQCEPDEHPSHLVTLSGGFWIAETEVTVGQWSKVNGQLPARVFFGPVELNPEWGNAQMPILGITWHEASSHCSTVGGRLPTEAEWEYAARAGSSESRYGRVNEVAWYASNSGTQWFERGSSSGDEYETRLRAAGATPREVGRPPEPYRSNAWGLYDMLGNVLEWVADDYAEQAYEARPGEDDPLHRTGVAKSPKVSRGGSWFRSAEAARVSWRGFGDPGTRYVDTGVRCVWSGPSQ